MAHTDRHPAFGASSGVARPAEIWGHAVPAKPVERLRTRPLHRFRNIESIRSTVERERRRVKENYFGDDVAACYDDDAMCTSAVLGPTSMC